MKLNIEVFSMGFVREIGRNGVLYLGIWPRLHGTESNRIDISERVKQLIKFKKRDINDIPSVI